MNTYYIGSIPVTDELYHHGILGQKWGVRRYQNSDGTLTAAGKERYGSDKEQKKLARSLAKSTNTPDKLKQSPQFADAVSSIKRESMRSLEATKEYNRAYDELEKHIYNEKNYERNLDRAVDGLIKENPDILNYRTKEELKNWYRYDDGDQNEHGIFETFVRDNPNNSFVKTYTKAEKNDFEAGRELKSAASNYAKKYLGSYGDLKLSELGGSNSNVTAGERMTYIILRDLYKS